MPPCWTVAVDSGSSAIVFPSDACPPLRSRSLDVLCRAPGQRTPAPCDRPQPPGTLATFKCKPLHQNRALPASAYSSRCGEDGSWSVRLFTCSPGDKEKKKVKSFTDKSKPRFWGYPTQKPRVKKR